MKHERNRHFGFYLAPVLVAVLSLSPRAAVAVDPLNPSPNCSPLDPGPCTPSYCGVFGGAPCVPYYLPPIGQDLHLTIVSRDGERAYPPDPDRRIDTIGGLFAALRGCWEPPPRDDAHRGVNMNMTVRFAFKRTGELTARPRVTYVSRDADDDARRAYREAIDAALERCTPMPFSKGLAGAMAGRPIAIRFVDDRPD